MTMPPGYTPPGNQPAVDPATGLPVPPNSLGGQPFQPPAPVAPGVTINVNDPNAGNDDDPANQFISRAQMEQILNEERERVRKEEKDKLYPRIEELDSTVKTLKDAEEAREAERLAAEQAAAEAERLRQESEMTALERLQQTESTWEQRFAEMQADRDRERVMREKEAQLGQLQAYRAQRMAEESSDIAPQFLDYITGGTMEEIEASIASAKQKTAEIVNEFQQAGLQNRRGAAPPIAGAPPVNPADMTGEGQTRTLSAQEIADMPMAEYQQYRSQLLSAGSQRVRDQGLYAP